MKIKDIHKQLPKNIDLQRLYTKHKLKVGFCLGSKSSKDIHSHLIQEITCQINKKIILHRPHKKQGKIDALSYEKYRYLRTINALYCKIITFKYKKVYRKFYNDTKKICTKKEKSSLIKKNFQKKENNSFIKNIFTKKEKNSFIKKELCKQKALINVSIKKNIGNINFRKKKYSFKKIRPYFYITKKKIQILFSVFLLFSICILGDIYLIKYFTKSGYQTLLTLSTEKREFGKKSKSAGNDFFMAHLLLTPFLWINNTDIQNASLLIQGGEQIATLINDSTKHIKGIKAVFGEKKLEEIMFSQLLKNNQGLFLELEENIRNITSIYSKVHFTKEQYILSEKLENLTSNLKKAHYYISTLNNNFDTFLEILGHSKRKKYVIAFQNNDEIRAQGGFMGSLGMIEVFRGQIKEFNKNDIYFYEFKLKKEKYSKELAPEGINKMTQYLGLRDSNYFIDEKKSSQHIESFMKKAGYPIDGVIYMNKGILSDIFSVIGDVKSHVLQDTVNEGNFSMLMSVLVEGKVSKQGTMGTPKLVLFNFIDELKKKIFLDKNHLYQMLSIVLNNISSRNISITLSNKEQQILLNNLSLHNKIKFSDSIDFSYPVFTSIGGNKSDRYMKHNFIKTITKGKKCGFDIQLQIQSTHTFSPEEEKNITNISEKYGLNTSNYIEHTRRLKIQGKGENKQYIRVVIPNNAQIKNKNITVKKYNSNAQVVSFYVNTKQGKTSHYLLNYSLPNRSCTLYNSIFYKQPGIPYYDININIFGKNHVYSDITTDFKFKE